MPPSPLGRQKGETLMSLEHWAWLGIATQPGSETVDDILRVFPDPEEFFLSGDSGIEKVGSISEADALRIRATSLDVAKKAVETAYNYGAKVITKESEFYPKGLPSKQRRRCSMGSAMKPALIWSPPSA